jgi:hypothetical protein
MKHFLFILLTALITLAACKTVEYVPVPVEHIVRETVTVRDTVIDVRIEHTHDSVTVPLSRDTVNYLENQYAYSYALVTGGDLVHSLGTQKGTVPVRTEYIEIIRTDSIPYTVKIDVPGKEVIIHKPTLWQRVTHIALGIVMALSGIILYRIFKK